MDRKSRRLRIVTLIFVLFCAGAAESSFAQAIDTNRPGFSFSPNVVPAGRWQLETGIAWDRPDSNTEVLSLPLAELRYGMSDGFELYLSSISWSDADFGGSSADGLLDMVIGTKLSLGDTGGPATMAVLFQVSVPAGSSEFSSDRWDPSAAFVWSYAGRVPLAGTVKVSRFANGFQLDNGLKLPFAIGADQSAFVEWEANLPEGGGSTHWLNGGYQFLLTGDLQWDLNAGLGLNNRAGDYRLGLGFSMRF
jgi:hypothetical protein